MKLIKSKKQTAECGKIIHIIHPIIRVSFTEKNDILNTELEFE